MNPVAGQSFAWIIIDISVFT